MVYKTVNPTSPKKYPKFSTPSDRLMTRTFRLNFEQEFAMSSTARLLTISRLVAQISLAVCTLFSLGFPAASATLRAVDSPHCFATLDGTISAGDDTKIQAAIKAILPPPFAEDGGYPSPPWPFA